MLNPFPIQFLALFAYAILRVIVGIILTNLGLEHIRNRHSLSLSFDFPILHHGLFFAWCVGVGEIILGTMFFLGFFTQIAALFTMIMSLKFIILNRRFGSPLVPQRLFYVLLFGVSLSLFITGAGMFAFDLPL